MNDYLIDRETLGRFVDELIKNKTLPVDNADELNAQREQLIKDLDKKIGLAIFGKLTKEQATELNQLFDQDDTTEETYQAFFDKIGLDIEQTASEAMKEFAREFLGGANE